MVYILWSSPRHGKPHGVTPRRVDDVVRPMGRSVEEAMAEPYP